MRRSAAGYSTPKSAKLLAQNFAEWKGLIPYFTGLRALGAEEFRALAGFDAAVRVTADPNGLAGEWHALVKLIAMAHKAGSLDDAAAAHAFGHVCRTLSEPADGVALLRSIAGGGNLDDAVAAGLLRLTGEARARFERVRELQGAPKLSMLTAKSSARTVALAVGGAVYGAALDPSGLLVNEDRKLLAKHLYTAPGAAWAAASSLFASNQEPGSHFAGGFANFEDVVRGLASGGHAEPLSTVREETESGGGALFRADARLVEVHTTVMDERGRYVDGLSAERFTVREKGNTVAIAAFENATAPISCALLLDTTESMETALPALKSAARKLIDALRPDDAVAVYSLSEGISELQPFGTDKLQASRAVLGAEPGGRTALYDGLVRVIRDFSGRNGKKIIVVFTDGEDNASTLTAQAAVLRARTAGIPIYTIAQGHAVHDAALLKELGGMSQATGGLSFTIQGESGIAGVFERVVQDLLHGYLLAFRPPTVEDHGWRPIEVVLRGAPGTKVRAREGYFQ